MQSYKAQSFAALEHDVEVFVLEDGQTLYVTIRGTQFDLGDIVRDVRGIPWYDGRLGWCHAGFLKGIRDGLWHVKAFRAVLEKAAREGLRIVIVGHSKGGAEGAILAALITLELVRPAALVTFGAAGAEYGDRLSEILAGVPAIRFERGADCVPDHPFLAGVPGRLWRVGLERTFYRRWIHPTARFTDHQIAGYYEDVPEDWPGFDPPAFPLNTRPLLD